MNFWKRSSLLILGASLASAVPPLPFNEKDTPESLDDFRQIQAALQSNLSLARAATVCLQVGESSGTAVIVSEDGLILTAAHVIGGVGVEMKVLMEDGRELDGISLGLNSETDAAMVRLVGPGPYPYVDFDKGDTTKLGDWVFALGHSGGFDKERGINVRVGRLVRESESTVQSDCILIGGDSGGPLFNMRGELIAIHSRVGGSKETSMHVPLREFQKQWEELEQSKFVGEGPFATKSEPGSGFLGLLVEPGGEGELRVVEVWEGSIATEAGIKVGDLILEVAGEPASEESLTGQLDQLGAGDPLKLKWTSGDETKEETLKLGERP